MGSWTTRFAPAPTGFLHLGHAVNALYVWGLVQAAAGRVLLRIEDHDSSRSRPEFERAILEDLDWLGIDVPGAGNPAVRVPRQSDRGAAYERALARVDRLGDGQVFACECSRRDVAAVSRSVEGSEAPYPGTCRARNVPRGSTSARRIRMEAGAESFIDVARGEHHQDPALQCGDVLVRDRAGNWTYQFAVVVDDAEQGVDVVIRGEDLLESTGRQIRLARLIGRETPPVFLHHPVVRKPTGEKLSKSDGDTGLRELRAAGWDPSRVWGEAARLAGLQREPRTIAAGDLHALFED